MAYKILDNCIGCTVCASSCPVFAIDGSKKQKHTINPDRCVDCGVCGRVCPVGAIVDEKGQGVKKVPKKEWKIPKITREDCSACQICIDVCPSDVIEIIIPGNKDVINAYAAVSQPKKCVSCQLCEINCPLKAIKMEVQNV